ncbi:GE37468 family thiazolyl peptide [Kibdelosporangium persicum]
MDSDVLAELPSLIPMRRTGMSTSRRLDFDLENLPMDVFDIVDSGLTVESLTAGHGMAENGASCSAPGGGCSGCSGTTWDCCCSCGTD